MFFNGFIDHYGPKASEAVRVYISAGVLALVLYIAVSWSLSDQTSISSCLRAAALVLMP